MYTAIIRTIYKCISIRESVIYLQKQHFKYTNSLIRNVEYNVCGSIEKRNSPRIWRKKILSGRDISSYYCCLNQKNQIDW